jgi:hypothetical protein
MWQGHLIRPVLSQTSSLSQPPPRRVSTPTADGFEHFLWACPGLTRGEGTSSRVRSLQAQPGATRPRVGTHAGSHFDRVVACPWRSSYNRASAAP